MRGPLEALISPQEALPHREENLIMEGVINHGFLSDLHGPVRTIHKVIRNGINSRQFTCVNEYETKPMENIKTFNSRGQFMFLLDGLMCRMWR